jgi:hypothetical protein
MILPASHLQRLNGNNRGHYELQLWRSAYPRLANHIVVFPTIFAFAVDEIQSFTPLYIALACICLYAPVSWLLNGILTTYTQSA